MQNDSTTLRAQKLNEAAVVLILTDPRADGALAFEFGVRENTISRVRCGVRWAHVAPEIPRARRRLSWSDGAALIRAKTQIDAASGCWLWTAAVQSEGYGLAQFRRHIELAHRIAFRAFRGPIANGLRVLHTCDTPRCCNPTHLFESTDQDNKDDCVRKGRHARGPAHAAAIARGKTAAAAARAAFPQELQ